VDGGVTGRVRAETGDEQAAAGLRDLVRGGIALARLQTGSHPELRSALDSLQLSGEGQTISLAFDLSSQALDLLVTAVRGLPRGTPDSGR
jgi:hypothetical protein